MRIFCVFPSLLDFAYNSIAKNQGGSITQLSKERIKKFANYLCREEKSAATQEKYLREAQTYCTEDKKLTKAEYLRLLAASKKNGQLIAKAKPGGSSFQAS